MTWLKLMMDGCRTQPLRILAVMSQNWSDCSAPSTAIFLCEKYYSTHWSVYILLACFPGASSCHTRSNAVLMQRPFTLPLLMEYGCMVHV